MCQNTPKLTLKLPIYSCEERDLQGASQLTLHNKSIIDEMSMLGQKTFAWVDKRLRQATCALEEPLGGVSVLMFGDCSVTSCWRCPLFVYSSTNGIFFHGYSMYRMFTTVVLSQVLRQAGNYPHIRSFREQLLGIREGAITHSDWKMLLRRSPTAANTVFNTPEKKIYKLQM